jgi:hypothetical protein
MLARVFGAHMPTKSKNFAAAALCWLKIPEAESWVPIYARRETNRGQRSWQEFDSPASDKIYFDKSDAVQAKAALVTDITITVLRRACRRRSIHFRTHLYSHAIHDHQGGSS